MKSMVDMARSPEDDKKDMSIPVESSPYVGPKYPYGLCICLCDDEIDKLGIDGMPDAGDMVLLNALAKVTSVNMSERDDGTSNRRIELQITHMGVDEDQPSPDDGE